MFPFCRKRLISLLFRRASTAMDVILCHQDRLDTNQWEVSERTRLPGSFPDLPLLLELMGTCVLPKPRVLVFEVTLV